MHLSGQKLTLEQTLLAIVADGVNSLLWAQSKDAQKGRNRPKSILKLLQGAGEKEHDYEVFNSLEEFEERFNSL